MVGRIRDLIERYPEDEQNIRELIRNDATFEALCQEYAETREEIRRSERLRDRGKAAEMDWLKGRHEQIEQEILSRVEGYRPV